MTSLNNNPGNPDRYNFMTEIIIQAVCFYLGIGLFLVICMIPPFVVMLPYVLPIVFMVCMIMNIGFIMRFVQQSREEITEFTEDVADKTGISDELLL
jgi:hypothetical protein